MTAPARAESSGAVGSSARMMRDRLASARDGHPLRFAARKLCRHRPLAMADFEIVEERVGALAGGRPGGASELQDLDQVFGRVEERQQVRSLEDESEARSTRQKAGPGATPKSADACCAPTCCGA